MAKIALVGYGSEGKGIGLTDEGYAYVVNDNVRTGQVLQPVATNWRNGKKFVTTGKVRHAYKETSTLGQEVKSNAEFDIEEFADTQHAEKIERAYTGKELGAKGEKQFPQQAIGSKHKPLSAYEKSTRQKALAQYVEDNPSSQPLKDRLTKNAYDTFESYSRKFMGKGEQ